MGRGNVIGRSRTDRRRLIDVLKDDGPQIAVHHGAQVYRDIVKTCRGIFTVKGHQVNSVGQKALAFQSKAVPQRITNAVDRNGRALDGHLNQEQTVGSVNVHVIHRQAVGAARNRHGK